MSRHRFIIIGSGFGGQHAREPLTAAERAEEAEKAAG
jgi:hypothetical protein